MLHQVILRSFRIFGEKYSKLHKDTILEIQNTAHQKPKLIFFLPKHVITPMGSQAVHLDIHFGKNVYPRPNA